MGQNEDYSPGGSISDSSEIPLPRGRRTESMNAILVKGEVAATTHMFTGGCCWSHEGYCQSQGADVTKRDFSAFLDTRIGKNWTPENI